MLFLPYIKGDRVHEWAAMQVKWLGQRLAHGADPNDEYLMDTVENAFETAFRDTMSEQKAMGDFDTLVMEKGNLDEYINRFERLARLAGYDLNSNLILKKFGRGLVPGLYTSIINGMSTLPDFWTEWVRAAQKYQQKFLLVQSNLEGQRTKPSPVSKSRQQTPSSEPWRSNWKPRFQPCNQCRDPDVMDTTPYRIHTRQTTTADEQEELMRSGKCFTCKRQGHLSRDSPQHPPYRPRTNARASTSRLEDVQSDDEEPARAQGGKMKYSSEEIMDIISNAEESVRNEVIQKGFMTQDF
jgi:hypothetical protein